MECLEINQEYKTIKIYFKQWASNILSYFCEHLSRQFHFPEKLFESSRHQDDACGGENGCIHNYCSRRPADTRPPRCTSAWVETSAASCTPYDDFPASTQSYPSERWTMMAEIENIFHKIFSFSCIIHNLYLDASVTFWHVRYLPWFWIT